MSSGFNLNRISERSRPSLSRSKQPHSGGSEAGVTLLEALVAMIIITITVSIISPPIFIAVATRVSNRRTEQAMQLAQGEIERVRLLMLSSKPYEDVNKNGKVIKGIKDEIPPVDTNAQKDTIEQVAAPSAICNTDPCTSGQLVETSNENLYLQTFREDGATVNSGDVVAFRMGVRVYGAEAKDNLGSLKKEAGTVKFSTGTGSRGTRPLVTFYTEMIRGTEGGGLAAMQNPSWD